MQDNHHFEEATDTTIVNDYNTKLLMGLRSPLGLGINHASPRRRRRLLHGNAVESTNGIPLHSNPTPLTSGHGADIPQEYNETNIPDWIFRAKKDALASSE